MTIVRHVLRLLSLARSREKCSPDMVNMDIKISSAWKSDRCQRDHAPCFLCYIQSVRDLIRSYPGRVLSGWRANMDHCDKKLCIFNDRTANQMPIDMRNLRWTTWTLHAIGWFDIRKHKTSACHDMSSSLPSATIDYWKILMYFRRTYILSPVPCITILKFWC